MDRDLVRLSKRLSLILRHRPDSVGLRLDVGGWVDVHDLLQALRASGPAASMDRLRLVVERNDKQRFAFSPDGKRIRASQGHSVAVELGLEPRTPPDRLFHGTVARFLESIRRDGLKRGQRTHVHLSADAATATKVGRRRGEPVVLVVEAGRMCSAGGAFFLSANGVWLTEAVPPEFLVFPHDGP